MKRISGTCALTAFLAATALASPASAAPQWCGGSVMTSWTNVDGAVFISGTWRGDHTQLCSIRQEWKGVPVDTCISWVAKIDAAVAMNRQVTVYYHDAPACSALPLYDAAPPPNYIMMYNG